VAEDALAVVRRFGARATISKVLKGQASINTVDRSVGMLTAVGLVQGSLPENRAEFRAQLADATPASLAELRRVVKAILQAIDKASGS
jgi:protein-tyrosine phosphatase